jgi:glycosyltransferase involved in cell wall biosynthesis
MRVSAIIPAYNEAGRIHGVLAVAVASGCFAEIVVVDDGSSDGTALEAEQAGARVVRHERNQGKAVAMRTGLAATGDEIIAFLDADLMGVTERHLRQLIDPVRHGQARATLGVFRGGRAGTAFGQWLAPTMSGQRCLERRLLADFTDWGSGFGIETAINAHLRRQGVKLLIVEWRGAAQVMKEEKRGLLAGLGARLRMYWEMAAAWCGAFWRGLRRS